MAQEPKNALHTLAPLKKLFTCTNIKGDDGKGNFIEATEIHAAPMIAEGVNTILYATSVAIFALSFYLVSNSIWTIFDLLGSIWNFKVMG